MEEYELLDALEQVFATKQLSDMSHQMLAAQQVAVR